VSGLRGRQAVALVARREVTQRLREKSFLISMGVTTLIIVLVAVIPPLLGAGGPSKFTIAVTDASSAPVAAAARANAKGFDANPKGFDSNAVRFAALPAVAGGGKGRAGTEKRRRAFRLVQSSAVRAGANDNFASKR